MRQHGNKLFQVIPSKAKTDLLNNSNIAIFNNKVATTILIQDTIENIFIVQENTIWHIINRFQVECFAKANNQDIVLFFTQYFKIKRNSGQIVNNSKFLIVQNSDRNYIGPNLLYYYKKMLMCLLTNLNTLFGIINGAQIIVYRIIPNLEGNCKLF